MVTMLAISFVLLFKCSSYSTDLYLKYPVMPCDIVTKGETDTTLENKALLEFKNIGNLIKQGEEHVRYQGYLQCFCEEMKS